MNKGTVITPTEEQKDKWNRTSTNFCIQILQNVHFASMYATSYYKDGKEQRYISDKRKSALLQIVSRLDWVIREVKLFVSPKDAHKVNSMVLDDNTVIQICNVATKMMAMDSESRDKVEAFSEMIFK